ncbi:MAG: hypothetical protein QOH10_2413 [Actinomycetota bacterium]|jgi:hypothetical protein|nr:hypothetical protein [Actinomycetota bacterium]
MLYLLFANARAEDLRRQAERSRLRREARDIRRADAGTR